MNEFDVTEAYAGDEVTTADLQSIEIAAELAAEAGLPNAIVKMVSVD